MLCLSLDWNNKRDPSTWVFPFLVRYSLGAHPVSSSSLGDLIVSLSDGSLALLKPGADGLLSVVENWHAHDHEPWIAAWNYWDTNILYSGTSHVIHESRLNNACVFVLGGDDLKMKGWDVRQGFEQPTFTNRRYAFPCQFAKNKE